MFSEPEIGELSQKDEGVKIEWTIKDIFSYETNNKYYLSPPFDVPGSQWRIRIYPNGYNTDTVGWISVYLCAECTYPKDADFKLGVKHADGTIEEIFATKYVFKNIGYGFAKFMERSKLEQRKSELAPSGDLTITCSLNVNDSLQCSARLNKLSENLKNMFLSKKDCDATLKVKQEEFSVHKSILKARSPVFATMFEVDMKEKNTSTVDIVDCHPEAFKSFLSYVYSGEFENLCKDVFELYKIAHKYDVEDLKSACVQCMISTLSVENFYEAVVIGHQFDESELTSKTREFLDEKFTEIVSTSKWNSFLEENPALASKLLKHVVEEVKIKKLAVVK